MPTPTTLIGQSAVNELGRSPAYGQQTDPVTLARWAGPPSVAHDVPDIAVPPLAGP